MFVVNLLLLCFSIFLVRWFLLRTALIYAVRKGIDWIGDRVHVQQHFKVPELNDSTHQRNLFYHRVLLYLTSLPSLEDSDFTNLSAGKKSNDIVLSLDDNQTIHDDFLGARVSWLNRVERDGGSRSFVLRIRKKDKRRILKPYLQHIHAVSDEIEERGNELRIYNHCDGRWKSVLFNHPCDFDAIVLDPDLKAKIRHDLENFLKSKQYYHKLGRVWKRSYLLYGQSGTGKSSFIAAAANLLSYDVYYLSLSQIADAEDLNSLLIQTTSKSLIVVEDLDRYVSDSRPNSRMSSSCLLNFMDGLLNSQEERISIFTMNSKDGIDPALLRPGRIDMHIHFPLCDFASFKNLASNYLGVKEHKLFPQVEEIFQSGAAMSAAEISELMLVNRSSPSRALKSVISALQSSGGRAAAARPSVSSASSPAPPCVVEEGGGGGAWKEAMPKEFRKLYGLLRMKSCRRVGSFDQDEIERL
ncbi:hypothetical protein SASPL_155262 [Salvia splendens]|uniref:AAA+ ATPase domain-containing protein n=1 Tax=Salvia splendens TaxID=180675 RepID=A0A8X8W1L7_SALSN|nr:AAA-ATPase At2g46620-like [Salvia splendens]KAG6386363.1 hypothetical protein SASPL_155262 [Salvia splendens]